jgi:SHS2 domain-containing protein
MQDKKGKFEYLEHTADVKFRAFGKTLGEAFENSALAMFDVMFSGKVAGKIKKKIKVSGEDNESLLYNFLEELLFLLDTENFFLADCKVKIKEGKKGKELEAELKGDNVKNYETNIDVKAATYNEMFVKQEGKKWVCQVVVDV